MTLLSNLLPYSPGHSGFSSYVRRVIPGLPGHRLWLDPDAGAVCREGEDLPDAPPRSRLLNLLQRLSLSQHGVDLDRVLSVAGLKRNQIAVVYSPYADSLLSLKHVPQVITCHDLTPLFFPNNRRVKWRYRFWTPVHLRHATTLIAISRFVADQLVNIGVPSSKIEVITNGISIERPAIEAPRSHDIVMLARHDSNKNVSYVVKAFGLLLERQPHWQGRLVVVGRSGRATRELIALLRTFPRPQNVLLLPELDSKSLVRLLRGALALVSASLMEGFDYPVLEAKAEGLPTLISDIPVHRELHAGTSLMFALDDRGCQLVDALIRLATVTELWKQLSLQGHQCARSLTLDVQQNQILSLLNPWIS